MRIPKTLSYSSFSLCEKSPEEFYTQYLSPNAPTRTPQGPPLAVGSSFDAYVKAALHHDLFGGGADPRYEFSALFESQVEKQNWDFALRAGKHVFKAYKVCGAYNDLLFWLKKAIKPPRFEFRIERAIDGVPFMGKPDCQFVLNLGQGDFDNVYDWKVRGYCSKYATSPSKGYATCLDTFQSKPSRSHGKEHALYMPRDFHGLTINAGFLETCSTDYADQLCLYSWILGETPGDENVVLGIEEIVSKCMGEGVKPDLRYARHRALCRKEYQLKLLERIHAVWDRIISGHFFNDMSKEDSDARCEVLDEVAAGQKLDGGETGEWFNDVARPMYFRK
jgi:hypothetical protein